MGVVVVVVGTCVQLRMLLLSRMAWSCWLARRLLLPWLMWLPVCCAAVVVFVDGIAVVGDAAAWGCGAAAQMVSGHRVAEAVRTHQVCSAEAAVLVREHIPVGGSCCIDRSSATVPAMQ